MADNEPTAAKKPMPTDTKPSLTAAELRAIGARVNDTRRRTMNFEALLQYSRELERDRARLYAALVGLLDEIVFQSPGRKWIPFVIRSTPTFETKDAAIDALLQGGGE